MNRDLNIELKIWGITNICFSIGLLTLIKEDFVDFTLWMCFWIIPVLFIVFILTLPAYAALCKISDLLVYVKLKQGLKYAILVVSNYIIAFIYSLFAPLFILEDNESYMLLFGSVTIAVILTSMYLVYKESAKTDEI